MVVYCFVCIVGTVFSTNDTSAFIYLALAVYIASTFIHHSMNGIYCCNFPVTVFMRIFSQNVFHLCEVPCLECDSKFCA